MTIGGLSCIFSGFWESWTTEAVTSALTNSTVKPNSSATIVNVSASNLWLIEAKIPIDINVPITSFGDLDIIDANSETETNSVSFKVLFSCSVINSSISILSEIACLFSLLNLDDLDFPLLLNLAKVSLISFWISSGVASVFWGVLGFFLWSLKTFLPAFSTLTFLIRFRFLLKESESLSTDGVVFSVTLGNSILPTTLGPDNFLASAFIVSETEAISSLVESLFEGIGSGIFSSLTSSFTGSDLLDLEDKSILPRTEGLEIKLAFATIFSTCFFGSSFLIEITFLSGWSITTLSAFSFSNFSFWYSSNNIIYKSSPILVFGLELSSFPLEPKNSTIVDIPTLSSLATLLSLLTTAILY